MNRDEWLITLYFLAGPIGAAMLLGGIAAGFDTPAKVGISACGGGLIVIAAWALSWIFPEQFGRKRKP